MQQALMKMVNITIIGQVVGHAQDAKVDLTVLIRLIVSRNKNLWSDHTLHIWSESNLVSFEIPEGLNIDLGSS